MRDYMPTFLHVLGRSGARPVELICMLVRKWPRAISLLVDVTERLQAKFGRTGSREHESKCKSKLHTRPSEPRKPL